MSENKKTNTRPIETEILERLINRISSTTFVKPEQEIVNENKATSTPTYQPIPLKPNIITKE